jgi:aerobic carbon-monoxide dehydrogenase small subunit
MRRHADLPSIRPACRGRTVVPRRQTPQTNLQETLPMGMQITLTVNGESVTRETEPNQLLVQFIRDTLRLTGTHVGCDTTQCGACTVHVDGKAVKSCGMLTAQAAGKRVTTIEGLAAADGTLHPMQAAFRACHGLQCGFCTPGMVMSAVDLVQHHGCHNEQQVREALEGNICRCTGYHNIVKAVQQGAAAMQA